MRPKRTDKQPNVIKNTPASRVAPSKPASSDVTLRRKSVDINNPDNSKLVYVKKEAEEKQVLKKTCNEEQETADNVMTVVNSVGQSKINCRLCDKDITGKECQLLYDQEENVETRLGRKINIIINSTETQLNLSQYCCSVCTSKIEICFSLLVEIQASDEVIKQTYGNLSNGVPVDTSTQLFICGECKSTITGIKSFIRHYENHILKKTVINSRSDVKVSQLVPESVSTDVDSIEDSKVLQFNGKLRGSEGEEAEVESDQINEKVRKRGQKKSEGVLSSDELYEKNTTDAYDSNTELGPSKLDDMVVSDHEGDDKDEELSDSEASVSSDTSYNKLVSIVKKELEKPDSDEEPNMEMTVNADGQFFCSSCNQAFEYKFLLAHHLAKDHKWNGFEDESDSEILKAELDDDGLTHCPQCQESVPGSKFEAHLEYCYRGEIVESGDILCHACGKLCSYKQWPAHKKKHINHAGKSNEFNSDIL
ncbi:UNVERIFIED_CONTAM: hypothetical protein PYX00_010431 [Menopon gallinae]|uniref:C2H2-type domain-containing protein n=1 Tax=Menopon gallinae TaxID=328185 RepID=A0AAW2HFA9_9NEOP